MRPVAAPPTLRILLRLTGGFGLGDVTQFAIVLKHLAKYRPQWRIDCRTAGGTVGCLRSHCHLVYAHSDTELPTKFYHCDANVTLQEPNTVYTDRPNTKVAYLLQTMFGIEPYDLDLGGYQVLSTPEEMLYKRQLSELPLVWLHAHGGSHNARKDLTETQVMQIRDSGRRLNLLVRPLEWTRTVGSLAASIHYAKGFIGIDSGPGKVASAMRTPTLICWTKNHPIRFHDPAENTLHLVPRDWMNRPPCRHPGVAAFFEKHYQFWTYNGEADLAKQAGKWLESLV